MKTIRFTMAILVISLTALVSCSKSDLTAPQRQGSLSASSSSNLDDFRICGDPVVYNLIDHSKTVLGTISISNDETNLFVTFNITSPDFKLAKAALVIGTLAHVQAGTNTIGWPKLGQGPISPDFTQTSKPEVTSYTFTIPLSNYEDCFYISAYGKLVKRDPTTNKVVASDFVFIESQTLTSKCWSTYVNYCKQDCPPPGECGQLRTQTQGGYGNDQGNGEPTQYLIANFDAAFPSGVTIGCNSGFTQKMTTAASIQAYLPSSSTPAILTQNYVDNGPNTVLGGQLLTLALNVGFDDNDPNFGPATIHLGNMIIGSGDFAGKTVYEFLAIANDVFGGCSSAYTPSQINSAATSINENYDNVTVDKVFLTCPNNK
jgi:hypothetical protein